MLLILKAEHRCKEQAWLYSWMDLVWIYSTASWLEAGKSPKDFDAVSLSVTRIIPSWKDCLGNGCIIFDWVLGMKSMFAQLHSLLGTQGAAFTLPFLLWTQIQHGTVRFHEDKVSLSLLMIPFLIFWASVPPKDFFFKQVKHSHSGNVEVNGLELNSWNCLQCRGYPCDF